MIDPFAVESPSGRWRLEVQPSDRFATGRSRIRLLEDGETRYETELPFTWQVFGTWFEPLAILDAGGKLLTTQDRMPDGRWSRSPQDGALAADGRAALLMMGAVALPDSSGRPERMIPLPQRPWFGSHLSINGRHALVSARDPEALIYALDDERWERVQIADKEQNVVWAMGLSPDGNEVIAVDRKTYTLRRYGVR